MAAVGSSLSALFFPNSFPVSTLIYLYSSFVSDHWWACQEINMEEGLVCFTKALYQLLFGTFVASSSYMAVLHLMLNGKCSVLALKADLILFFVCVAHRRACSWWSPRSQRCVGTGVLGQSWASLSTTSIFSASLGIQALSCLFRFSVSSVWFMIGLVCNVIVILLGCCLAG
jgi:hypothetical protein